MSARDVVATGLRETQAQLAEEREAAEARQLDLLAQEPALTRWRGETDEEFMARARKCSVRREKDDTDAEFIARAERQIKRQLPETDDEFAQRKAAIVDARKGGRPKGATGLVSRELREYAERFGPNPIVALMKVLDLGHAGLAEELGCSRLEAFDRWLSVAGHLRKAWLPDLAPTDSAGKSVPFMAQVINGMVLAPGQKAPEGMRMPWEDNVDVIDVPANDEAAS